MNSSKIAFASKSEIAATYMARSLGQSNSPPSMNNKTTNDFNDSSTRSDPQQQLLPPNLRLNDDILSVHFNNVTSTVKKRHSLSDPADSLIKYLSANASTSNVPSSSSTAIQVRDDSINQMLTDTKISPVSTTVAYENLLDLQANLHRFDEEQQQQQQQQFSSLSSQSTINAEEQHLLIESVASDSDSDGEHSDGGESAVSSPTMITPTVTTTSTTTNLNLKPLLKTPTTPKNLTRRVMFDPLALLLDAAVVGELPLVIKAAKEVRQISFIRFVSMFIVVSS